MKKLKTFENIFGFDLGTTVDDYNKLRDNIKDFIVMEVDKDVSSIGAISIEQIPIDDDETEIVDMLHVEALYKMDNYGHKLDMDTVMIDNLDNLKLYLQDPKMYKNSKKYNL